MIMFMLESAKFFHANQLIFKQYTLTIYWQLIIVKYLKHDDNVYCLHAFVYLASSSYSNVFCVTNIVCPPIDVLVCMLYFTGECLLCVQMANQVPFYSAA